MPETLKLFLSSPGDVPEERALAERVVRRLGHRYRERFTLVLYLWEQAPLSAHGGFQDQIEPPSQCDLLVALLWSRLGTRLPPSYAPVEGSPAPTGTEFEILDALAAYRRSGRPDIWIYRRSTPPRIDVTRPDAQEQLDQFEALDAFCARQLQDPAGHARAHHRYAEPHDFERGFTAHLRAWLDSRLGKAQASVQWFDGSPYRGLEVFDMAHRDVYFGRTQSVSEVLKCMRHAEAGEQASKMLLIQGMSGIGKSSLLRAGLLPLLEGRAIEGIGAWVQMIIKPSDIARDTTRHGPVAVLAEQLLAALPDASEGLSVASLATALAEDPTMAVGLLHGYLSQRAQALRCHASALRLIICIDQLEECWSFDSRQREGFARCLLALANEGRIWVIATVRSDFVPRMMEARDFASLLDAGQVFTQLAPRPDELVEMIREPAAAAGLQWERRSGVGLDQVVLRDAISSPEGLPLLEFALEQLYVHRRGSLLTFEAYEAFGGLAGSIADAAESCVAPYADDTAALRSLFRLLVRVEADGTATRRRPERTAFAGETAAERVLSSLEARRLCLADGPHVVFAHEALITAWPRLREWLSTEMLLLQARELLATDAAEWRRHGQPRSLLATAPEKVIEARRLIDSRIDVGEDRAFIEASVRRASGLRTIRRVTVAGIVALSIAALFAAHVAAQRRDEARLARAQALAVQSEVAMAEGDRDSAATLAAQAQAAWQDAHEQPDPTAAFMALKAALVSPVPTQANQHAPMLEWYFSSNNVRRSSLLSLATSYGDAVVADPVQGGAVLLPNHGGRIVAVGGSPKHEFITIDEHSIATRHDGHTGVRKAALVDVLPSGAVGTECNEDGCDMVGWNQNNNRCELVSIVPDSSPPWRVRRWPLRSGAEASFSTRDGCAWAVLQRRTPNGVIAIENRGHAWAIDTDGEEAKLMSLGANVIQATVLDTQSVVIQRKDVIERFDIHTAKSDLLSRNAAKVSRLGVAVQGGLVVALSEDGTAEFFRDGRIYRSVSTGDTPVLRIFELAGSRAVLEVSTSARVRLIDYRNGRELYRWSAAPAPLRGAFYSAAAHRLSVLTAAGDLQVWDVSQLEAMATLPLPETERTAERPRSEAVTLEAATPPAANAVLQHVIADVDADVALMHAGSESWLFHRGQGFRSSAFAPTMAAAAGTGHWHVSDGATVWSLTIDAGAKRPSVRPVWRAASDSTVKNLRALEGNIVSLQTSSSLVLLQADGSELLRTGQSGDLASLPADLFRATRARGLVVVEDASCDQWRIHPPSGRVLMHMGRLCEAQP